MEHKPRGRTSDTLSVEPGAVPGLSRLRGCRRKSDCRNFRRMASGGFDIKGGSRNAHFWRPDGLSCDTILSLCMDREGKFVGRVQIGRGLDCVKRSYFEVLDGSEGKTVQSVCEGQDNDLWIGFNGGGVVHQRDGVWHDFGGAPYAYVQIGFPGQGAARSGQEPGDNGCNGSPDCFALIMTKSNPCFRERKCRQFLKTRPAQSG